MSEGYIHSFVVQISVSTVPTLRGKKRVLGACAWHDLWEFGFYNILSFLA